MSIRHSLLALLYQQPRHGYQLRSEFESRTRGAWPLNIGQVYTTLDRLERDGLVRSEAGDDGDSRVIYSITDAGRAETDAWFGSAVVRADPPRNELAIKVALAVTLPGVDVATVIQAQREATLGVLQEYSRSRRDTAANQRAADTAWLLILDSLVFHAEAELRWLDLCEARMMQLEQNGVNGAAG
jgi:DNA-binding PadR family transcriptional regulator